MIDIQKGFDNVDYWGGQRNNPDAENNAGQLLSLWRRHKLPLFHVQHCSSNPSSLLTPRNPGNEFKEIAKPLRDEPVIQKNVNSAFIGTELKALLDLSGTDTVILIGFTTDHCVSTTARMAANYGYKTFVVSDATAAFAKKGISDEQYDAQTIHLTALAHLKDEFATIVTTAQIVGEFENKK